MTRVADDNREKHVRSRASVQDPIKDQKSENTGFNKDLSRRGFLSSSSAVVASMLADGKSAMAQRTGTPPSKRTRLIDIHHHYSPPVLQTIRNAFQLPSITRWTPELSIEKMDRDGIHTAIVQIAGVPMTDASRLPALCRECNEFGAKMVADYPGRFGFFAFTPLPDVDASLKELEYALDTLHADGLGLLSHYGKATYLGDKVYAPLWQELNRRKAVVFVHPRYGHYVPTTGSPEAVEDPFIQAGLLSPELPFDTTRAVYSLQSANADENYPNVKIIVAHAGGTALTLPARMAYEALPPGNSNYTQTYESFLKFLSSLYYDFTIAFSPAMIKAVTITAPASHWLCGTDFPPVIKANHEVAQEMVSLLRRELSAEQFAGVERGNAEALFPRFKDRT